MKKETRLKLMFIIPSTITVFSSIFFSFFLLMFN